MISTNDFRTGLTIELDNEVYQIIDFQHVKPGKGGAFVRSKIRNLRTGAIIRKTFNAGEKVPRAHLDRREIQYLYYDGTNYNFMDLENYEQITLTATQLGEGVKYLKESMTITSLLFQGKSIGVDLPNFVELKVADTAPGVKGDTVSGGSKPATLETGAVVQVPLFVNEGDVLQIDTRSGQYIKRVQ